MVSRFSRESVRTLRELEGDLDDQTIVWCPKTGGSFTLVCIPKSSTDSLMLTIGGSTPDSDEVFLVAIDRFPDKRRPEAKDGVLNGKVRLRIDSVNTASDGSFVRLGCNLFENKS